MKEGTKGRIVYTLLYIVVIIGIFYGKNHLNVHRDLRNMLYRDFESFGRALEELDTDLSKILVLEDVDFSREKNFMDRNALLNFQRAKYKAADLGRYQSHHEYQYIYNYANDVIKTILADGTISPTEEGYIKALYNYNQILIGEYRDILGTVYDGWDYDQLRKLQKDIVTIYDDFSNKAETLLKTKEYNFLLDFRGDFKGADFLRAKEFSEEIFSKLIPDQSLNYDNRDEENMDVFVFLTSEDRGVGIGGINQEAQYSVEYHKGTKEVTLRLMGTTLPPERYTEEELDDLAEEILSTFDDLGFLYERKLDYSLSEGELLSITYSYIKKIDDVYDEKSKVQLSLTPYGFVRQFYIIDYNDEDILPPLIEKEEILKKFESEAEVQNIFMVRNINGETEYEVHIRYQDDSYGAIFDGSNGKLRYFGKEIRKYNQYIKE